MWATQIPATLPGTMIPTSSSWYNPANNQLVQGTNSPWPSNAYDAAGNLQNDPDLGPTNLPNPNITYDGENHLSTATALNNNVTTYDYDGEGRRVRRITVSGTTVFVYDAAGRLTAQYQTAPAPISGTQYFAQDHLGSTRLVTDSGGNVISRMDYFAFGMIIPGTASFDNRNTVPGYNGDPNLDFEFTGKERDAETGLDYFNLRYMSSAQGRFTSPDPLLWQTWSHGSDSTRAAFQRFISDPQGLNKYAYVRNNPSRYTDPTGLSYQVCDANGRNCTTKKQELSDAEFAKEKKDAQANGEVFKNGKFYHFDSNGSKVVDGTYRQTDVDLETTGQIVAAGVSQRTAHFNDFMATFAGASVAAGVVMGGASALAPQTLYHFTSEAGYQGIVESGQIIPGQGITGYGVYGTAANNAATVGWAGVPTDAVVAFSPGMSQVTPGLIPGLWWSVQPAVTTLFQYGIPAIIP